MSRQRVQAAAFEDGTCAGFRGQHLHDARGAFGCVGTGDAQAGARSHLAVGVVVQGSQQFRHGLREEGARGGDHGVCAPNR